MKKLEPKGNNNSSMSCGSENDCGKCSCVADVNLLEGYYCDCRHLSPMKVRLLCVRGCVWVFVSVCVCVFLCSCTCVCECVCVCVFVYVCL